MPLEEKPGAPEFAPVPPSAQRQQNVPPVSLTAKPADSAGKGDTPGLRPDARQPPTCEDGTIPQDDRARKEARWRSLEKLTPTVPGYTMLTKLGQGTYGVVWHAREDRTGIEVAIKFFAHGTSEQWQTLQAEVRQLAMLHADPGIVHLIDVEPDAVPPYFVMDYAERGSLATRLDAGPVPVEESVAIFRRIVEAMAYVHAKGIRHCDLKPGNILLDARGRPKVADFGQAHLSLDASPALGTFFYMAPEQADLSRQIPDTRWDVYGLGALLYAMVTGAAPRDDATLRAELTATEKLAHRLERYRAAVVAAPALVKHRAVPGMDGALADIISRCLHVDPGQRFHDANAILEALKRRDWDRQQRPLLIFGLLAPLILLLTLGGFGWYQGRQVLDQVREKQQTQVREDCKTAARLIQSVIKNKLLEQADRLKAAAGGESVRNALKNKERLLREALWTRALPGPGEDPRAHNLKELRDKLGYLGKSFESWLLTDEVGTALAGDVYVLPVKQENAFAYQQRGHAARSQQEVRFGKNFSWRQWFNGDRDHLDKDFTEDNREPILLTCAWCDPKAPAVRMTDGSYFTKRNFYALGLSAPVYLDDEANPGTKKLAGVLLGNISIEAFWKWLEEAQIPNGHALVLDGERNCVFPRHRFHAKDSLDGPSAFWDVLRHENPATWDHPAGGLWIDGREQLVGYAPIVDSEEKHGARLFHWLAVVAQDHKTVMQPLDIIHAQWRFWGFTMLIAACVMVLGMWLWLRGRAERSAHA
jgi:hypothetical protein